MSEIQVLRNLDELKNSKFCQPPPRHGLSLLYWFSTEYVRVTKKNKLGFTHDPMKGKFGFHFYMNKPDNNDRTLLPDSGQPYYEVGNLRRDEEQELPDYVHEEYSPRLRDSNKDRIMVSRKLRLVYVTEHIDQRDFNSEATYRISMNLLRTISEKSRDEFLNQMGYRDQRDMSNADFQTNDKIGLCRRSQSEEPSRSTECWKCCTIL